MRPPCGLRSSGKLPGGRPQFAAAIYAMKILHITGNDLTLGEVRDVVYARRPVALAGPARSAVGRSRAAVDHILRENKLAYAITTGVGQLSDVRIAPEQNRQLQLNLLRSHATGVGQSLSREETRCMILLRANSLARGYSGVRPILIDALCELLNYQVHPIIPSQGSVGASGDHAPLAHLALVLIGEGEAVYPSPKKDDVLVSGSGADALRAAGLSALQLEAKEAISLINGTQGMLAVGALALMSAEILADSADVIAALSLDALRGTVLAFDDRIHQARPHPGQIRVAANLRGMLAGSQIRVSHADCGRVQDAYSLRCIPQVHGAVRDTLQFCRNTFAIEMNSAVDNPLVFPAAQGEQCDVLSGGNFHGQPLAFALDYMAIALTSLGGISERRIERLVNPALNEGLPPFLASGAGLNSGFMMAQVTAASLVADNRVLAHPASVNSITTSGNKEDFVSMGMTSANKLKQVLINTRMILAIEALAAAQALDFLAPLQTGARARRAFAAIRKVSLKVTEDRVMAGDFEKSAALIASGDLARLLAP